MKYKEFFKEDMLPGGKGDSTTSKTIDPLELKMGIKVELEHTQDEKLAKEIATDHLTEDPHYYSKLKHAGLADELFENGLMGLVEPDNGVEKFVVQPNTQNIDKQTTPGTVFPAVESDPNKGPDMGGCIGNTKQIEKPSDVDSPSKDPSPTDHITGAMGNSPSNPNILQKCNGSSDIGMSLGNPLAATMPTAKDISIDISESKKLLKKMMKESTKGPATAFGPKEGFVPAAGDPEKDDHFVKGKRWTVNYGKKTPVIKETDSDEPTEKEV